MTANAKEKRLVRQRMADTGENYTTALRRIREPQECPECQGTGIVDAPNGCGGCSGYPGIQHEPACGIEPCPRGCEVPAGDS